MRSRRPSPKEVQGCCFWPLLDGSGAVLSPLMIRIWYNFSVEVDQTSLLVALKKVSPPTKPLPKEEK